MIDPTEYFGIYNRGKGWKLLLILGSFALFSIIILLIFILTPLREFFHSVNQLPTK